ncbi:SOS response-associated peptidase [Phytomonospora sp. NPDC050363]|uniref:SOS response-associated peptidase n=1 Tax=Phytomonospora sp. NPDC050363 TaxID=3155642 RepID=UPI00340A6991
MCGRYASTRSATDLAALFEAVDDTSGAIEPGFNLAPTRSVPIVRVSKSLESRAVSPARWGLVPRWAKDPGIGSRMFNARSETVTTSNAYKNAFKRRRCLVPADGWYEWQKLPDGTKQPFYMTYDDGEPLVFAGLWETWGEDPLMSMTVLTTDAHGGLEDIHDRMPLVLTPDRWADWLGESDDVESLLLPPSLEVIAAIEARPVSKAVGNVRNDGAFLTDRVEAASVRGVEPPVEQDGAPTLF